MDIWTYFQNMPGDYEGNLVNSIAAAGITAITTTTTFLWACLLSTTEALYLQK